MSEQKFQPGEVDISAGLAVRLIAEQFPQWAGLPVRPVGVQGTSCVNYRLGQDLVIRLPRVPGGAGGLGAVVEGGMLARMARLLPAAVPELIGAGRPGPGYPGRWGVLRWIDGEAAVEGRLTAPGVLAEDLAGFLRALRSVGLPGGPPAYRGGPLRGLDEFTRGAIEDMRAVIDADAAVDVWEQAVALPAWPGPGRWIHADLMPGNLILRGGRLAAVIDFEFTGMGDPSRDLIVAWMLLPAGARPAFRDAVRVDEATWLRGRARALSEAIGHLRYYTGLSPVMAANARYTIGEVLRDYRSP